MSIGSGSVKTAFRHSHRTLQGLSSEYQTLRERWRYIGQTLQSPTILPDIFLKGGVDRVFDFYFSHARRNISCFEEEATGKKPSFFKMQQCLHEVKEVVKTLAGLLAQIKIAFYQRTDSLDLPYVIANIPLSPERSWGNELYLVAADRLVSNYLSFVDTHSMKWDRFISYIPYFPNELLDELPGGTETSLQKIFHLQLSEDAKYDLESYVLLAHEIGHAACRARQKRFGPGDKQILIPLPTYRVLWRLYALNIELLKILDACKQSKNITRTECMLPKLYEMFEVGRKGKRKYSRKSFIAQMVESPLAGYIEQVLADIVAMLLAGPHYINSLCDYIYDSIILHDEKSMTEELNDTLLFDLIFRVEVCETFAKDSLTDQHGQVCSATNRRILGETRATAKELRANPLCPSERSVSFSNCIECASQLGWLAGKCIAEARKEIFSEIIDIDKSVFETDSQLVRRLGEGGLVDESEPRKVFDACLKVMRAKKESVLPSALYSIALSRSKENMRTQSRAVHIAA